MARLAFDGFSRRLRRVERVLAPPPAPRSFLIVCEEGQAIPEDLQAILRPGDQVIIEEIPRDWFAGAGLVVTWYEFTRAYGVNISKV